MARLRRLAHRIVWINPRTAAPGFAPLAGGMAAALPYCDALVSGNTLASLRVAMGALGTTGRTGHSPTTQARPRSRTNAWSSRYLSTEPSVTSTTSGASRSAPSSGERGDPVDRLGHPGRLLQVERAQAGRCRRRLLGDRRAGPGHPAPHDLGDDGRRRVVDPVVQAAPLEGVAQVAGAVRREHHHRRVHGLAGAELGDRDRALGQQLQQEGLELVVGPVDLVDQQDDGPRARVLDGLQQRPGDEVVGAEEVVLGDRRTGRLGQPDAQQLARVVPLVERLGGVDALVALQPQQWRVEHLGQRLGRLGLADPGLAFEQDRLGQLGGEEQRRRQPEVGEVVDLVEPALQRSQRPPRSPRPEGRRVGPEGVVAARSRRTSSGCRRGRRGASSSTAATRHPADGIGGRRAVGCRLAGDPGWPFGTRSHRHDLGQHRQRHLLGRAGPDVDAGRRADAGAIGRRSGRARRAPPRPARGEATSPT